MITKEKEKNGLLEHYKKMAYFFSDIPSSIKKIQKGFLNDFRKNHNINQRINLISSTGAFENKRYKYFIYLIKRRSINF